MPKLFTLTNRLALCASFVDSGAKFIDIGTDHGYLPIWLLKTEKINEAIAADIGKGPLNSAKENAEKYCTNLTCILSDGFKNIEGNAFDTAAIAGMGGELISKIISEAPFVIDENKTFILQPMTASYELRSYLYNNGFSIIKEEAIKDMGKVYSVIKAKKLNIKEEVSEILLYMGKIEPNSKDSREYALKVIKGIENKIIGLKYAGDKLNTEKSENIIKEIKGIYLND